MTDALPTQSDQFHALKDEFRRHLETFYAGLKLAPPYESVEKAVRTLTTLVHARSTEEQGQILSDPTERWLMFRLAFEESGLAKKHRGIIAGLARNRSSLNLAPEYDHFLDLFHP